MGTLEHFLAYAADFEKTLVDDDWDRVTPYFAEDAIYRVESNLFGCELTGPSAICKGIQKSLNGFDRKFPGRDISVTSGPDVAGDELRLGWTVTYQKDGLPPFVLRGESFARLSDGKIALLVDSYDEQVAIEAKAWMQETGIQLDPSYV